MSAETSIIEIRFAPEPGTFPTWEDFVKIEKVVAHLRYEDAGRSCVFMHGGLKYVVVIQKVSEDGRSATYFIKHKSRMICHGTFSRD